MAGMFRGLARWLVLGFVCALATAVLPANAEDLGPADQKQIIAVVRGQLQAFARDDAAKAFSYAAPNIKSLVGNAQNFLQMVRTQYEVVYRPASTTFMQPLGHGSDAMLRVQMTDADGDAWVASYTLHKQANHLWRITGCSVAAATGTLV